MAAGLLGMWWSLHANPTPVAVIVQPVDDGVLCIRRGIEPCRGMLALPGGFIDLGETWQSAASRELQEQTGLDIDPAGVRALRVLSAPDSTLLGESRRLAHSKSNR